LFATFGYLYMLLQLNFKNILMQMTLLLVILMCSTLGCYAQQNKVDSLESLLKKSKEDTTKVILMNALCGKLKSTDPEKALKYGQSALALGKKIGYSKGIANSLNFIGVIYYIQSNYPQALDYYMQSLEIQKEIGYKKGIGYAYNNIGNIYFDQTDYSKALEFYLKSLMIQEEIKNKKGIITASANVGLIYTVQGNYIHALEYYQKSLKGAEEINDKELVASMMSNIGLIYYYLDNMDKALEYFFHSLKYARDAGAKNIEAADFNNIGDVYKSLGHLQSALEYYNKTLSINKKIDDKKGIAFGYLSLGGVYRSMKDFQKAQNYFDSCLFEAKQIRDRDKIKDCYKNKAEIYAATGDFTNAYQCHQMYFLENDSIFNEESNRHLLELQTKYETGKKEQEILILTKEKEVQELVLNKNRIIMYAFLAGFVLVLVIIFIVLKAYRAKRKLLQKEMELNLLKTQFVSLVTHEFRTPLAGIISSTQLLEKYYETWSPGERANFFEQIGDAVEQIKLMLEKTSVIGKDQAGKLSFNPKKIHFENFCIRLKDEAMAHFGDKARVNVTANSNIGEVLADRELLRHIIVNLLSNAIKYSPETSAADFIIDELPGNMVKITIQDKGIGIPEEDLKHIFEEFHRCSNADDFKGTGLGMSIVKRCVDIYNGEIEIKSEGGKGTRVCVTIPL